MQYYWELFATIRETLNAKITICSNSSAIFGVSKKKFLLTFKINCYFNFTGKNLNNRGTHLAGKMDAKDTERDTMKLKSITCLDYFDAVTDELISKYNNEQLLVKMSDKN